MGERTDSVPRVVVHGAVHARLLRESKIREDIAALHVVGVDVIGEARLARLIGDEEEKGIDGVVTEAAAIRESGLRIGAAARTVVGHVEVDAQHVASGDRDAGQDADVLAVRYRGRSEWRRCRWRSGRWRRRSAWPNYTRSSGRRAPVPR